MGRRRLSSSLRCSLSGRAYFPLPSSLPLPLSSTDCGSRCALSRIIRLVLCFPLVVGANVTAIVQCAPGASGAVQPFVTLNAVPATPLTPSISTGAPECFGLLTVMSLGPF